MGLIGNEMAPEEQGVPVPQEQAQANPGGEEELDPKSQDTYDRFMAAIKRALYDTDYASDLIQAIRSRDEVSSVISDSAYELIGIIDEKSGAILPDELMFTVAMDVLGEMFEIVEAAGAKVSGSDMAQALRSMTQRFFKEQGGTPEEIENLLGGIDMDAFAKAIEQGMGGEVAEELAEGQNDNPAEERGEWQ